MATLEELRTAATALPGTEEGVHVDMPAFSVRGRPYALLCRDSRVELLVNQGMADAAVATHPRAEHLRQRGERIGIVVPLVDLDDEDLEYLLHSAWACHAPRDLVLDHARRGGSSGAPADDASR
ncbi:MmcQ/YjbR family DNA-binding protein [Ornithinicoccus halotolerans]|uniref:MmcQ/YjbR family DNA-binding protein n=1 Tax=Ornithinicoccus halotolerans TaxID=1748220 RepID=UPI001295C728|nr:MmcQ/YjbR family DNA-binding protein [Ornithinicoccus halotolerans]